MRKGALCASISAVRTRGHQRPCRLRCTSQFPVASDRGPRCTWSTACLRRGDRCRVCRAAPGRGGRSFGARCLPVRGARRALCFPHAPPAAQRQATERQISPGSTKMHTYKNALDRSFSQRGGHHQTPAPDRPGPLSPAPCPHPSPFLPRPCPPTLEFRTPVNF